MLVGAELDQPVRKSRGEEAPKFSARAQPLLQTWMKFYCGVVTRCGDATMPKSDLNGSRASPEGLRAKKTWATPTIEDSSIGGTESKPIGVSELGSPVGSPKAGS
jgi:hypothetical protein